ncbi:bifunctional tetrahydrofolate synthase/dihydrofolate synthase [Legionella yabuuchiae]|uniref:bifunctional tetrahydrofolate synthase/dihydrofolate synthase n=1 Tax=Legionella yabuuchiae TaxID=376727 RepID=UPI001055B256|nr:bifunctional tetrahydrofolate synthase/dihydrofolate synthase [Legionella yabuuchiae]
MDKLGTSKLPESLNEWLFLLEHRHQQEMQLGLDRIRYVADKMGLATTEALVITVAGTNGKGSTIASLEAIYHEAGYRVGSYTSPHLIQFNERIRLNINPVTDAALCEAFQVIECGRGETHLTYFEMSTLAALWCFKRYAAEVILLEVGMGGRLDATNIIDSDLAIITTVGLDHQETLGNTIEEIGYEKAGIIRPEKPVIYADNALPLSVLRYAESLNAPVYQLAKAYNYYSNSEELQIAYQGEMINLTRPLVNLNCAVAAVIAAIHLNDRLPVSDMIFDQAMRKINVPGRLTVIPRHPAIVLDVAHNPQAAELLATFIHQYKPKQKVHAVFAALKDKDLCGLIKSVAKEIDFWYPALLSSKRASTRNDMALAFEQSLVSATLCYENPVDAFHSALNQAKPKDLIVVFGSFLTVGAILSIINTH